MNSNSIPHIPEHDNRIVIIGAGFGGLALAQHLVGKQFQVVLIDKHNFHQFQPLFYQVATAGLEPSSIAFPLRRVFADALNVHVRIAEVLNINAQEKIVDTSIGILSYHKLVIASGADTNFFGLTNVQRHALPMKTVSEALKLRNSILGCFEQALMETSPELQSRLMTIAIVGGGPTGVELAGTLAEMKKMVLPKDYPELDFNLMRVILIEAGSRVLSAMDAKSSEKALDYLKALGVEVQLNQIVTDYDGEVIRFKSTPPLQAATLVWAAGITANQIDGLSKETFTRGGRVTVSPRLNVLNYQDIYAIGDVCAVIGDSAYPNGHPQVAQVAIQQGKYLAKVFLNKKVTAKFEYRDLGSMATVGRNLAVVELPKLKFYGFFAWVVWMFVHLLAILGVRNKLVIFLNWVWNYITYDQSLRLIIKPKSNT